MHSHVQETEAEADLPQLRGVATGSGSASRMGNQQLMGKFDAADRRWGQIAKLADLDMADDKRKRNLGGKD
uniref:Uncharacterized protein n=1 Tax=Oryza punctata TaxID=4537 RepID=A0A0E0MM71_ORYPU